MSAPALIHDPLFHKLGRAPARHDKRTLHLANYLTALPAFPDHLDAPAGLTLGVMKNDELGDCTAAAKGHLVQVWTARNGSEQIISDDDVVAFYSASTGYDPADPSTDQGGNMVEVCNAFRSIGIGGHKAAAFVALEPKNRDHIKASCFLFGGVDLGVSLPISAQSQAVWSMAISGQQGDASPGSWGGHDVPIVAYNAIGPVCITWGGYKQMTWAWFDGYTDESYAILSADWAQSGKVAPSGFALDALLADLQAVAS